MHRNRTRLMAMLFLNGCLSACGSGNGGFGPGLTDFQADLPHKYFLTKASAHEVVIHPHVNCNDHTEIPRKVVMLGFDDQFILAQQQLMDARGRKPLRGQYQYWIIDAPAQKRYGPFTEEEFNAQRKALAVSESIKLKGTDSYRP